MVLVLFKQILFNFSQAKFQQKIEAHSAGAAQMQLEEDEHVRMLKAEHDTAMSTMQKQFAQVS